MKGYLFVLSLIAFAFSLLAFFSFKNNISIENGTLALIGICATLIVGGSLIDSLKIHQMEQKLEELENVKQDLYSVRTNSNIALNITWGLVFLNNNNYYNAFKYIYKANKSAWKENDAKRVDSCEKFFNIWREKINKLSADKRKEIKNKCEILIARDTDADESFLKKIKQILDENDKLE